MQPLSIAGHRFGELFIESRSGRLENWQQQLIETFCDNIARTFALSLQQEQESRLALFAERGTIARELHDSLALSLPPKNLSRWSASGAVALFMRKAF